MQTCQQRVYIVIDKSAFIRNTTSSFFVIFLQ